MKSHYKTYHPFIGPFDPCPPITEKVYSTPPNLYLGFQPPNLPQFSPQEALRRGTLWRPLYDPYYSPYEREKEETD
ncbi:spore coat associated protein CotJA [Heyndrickxia coagulans]|uniref:spore coat associated protein CotJA n=1 Tax=Heyndrickxia coagulans TaxID=1398 RepID=UPI002ECC2BD3|nr:spore coat associated protein CotJA [Heyndrickxia coagulans]